MKEKIKKTFSYLNYSYLEYGKEAMNFFSKERLYVRRAFDKLCWDASSEEQEFAVQYLAENLLPHEYIFLVLPQKYIMVNPSLNFICKSTWENAAKVIIRIGWPKIERIIIPLFMWLLDSNWPGSEMIYDFMLTIPKDIISAKMEEVLNSVDSYAAYDYRDLKEIIDGLQQELNQ